MKQKKENSIKQMESDIKTNEANIKLQDAFYGENTHIEDAPTYINNNTPAIKITGNNK